MRHRRRSGPVRFGLLALMLIGAAGALAGARMFRWDAQQRFAALRGKAWVAVAIAAWIGVGVLAETRGHIGVNAASSGASQGSAAPARRAALALACAHADRTRGGVHADARAPDAAVRRAIRRRARAARRWRSTGGDQARAERRAIACAIEFSGHRAPRLQPPRLRADAGSRRCAHPRRHPGRPSR